MVTRQSAPSFFLRYQALIRPPGPPPTIARSNMCLPSSPAAPRQGIRFQCSWRAISRILAPIAPQMIDLAHDLAVDPPPPKAGPGARFGGSLTRKGAFSPEGKMN